MDDMYVMYYTEKARSSHAVLVLEDGIISGADAMGGVLNGMHEVTEDGEINVSATLKSEPGTWRVTGNLVEKKDGLPQKITARLLRDFGCGNSIGIQASTGPVNAVFRKLRDAPWPRE
ncbi:MAG: hypothetical protein OXJ38_08505 [Gammaproteobacteria bacterium]|nr:hypothetical protein [Gammaproteobacteria bacterium]